jgi:hypothetical protein
VRLERVDRVDVVRLAGALHPIDHGLDRRGDVPRRRRAADRRRDQHEPRDPLRMGERRVDRERAAERASDEDRGRARDIVEHRDEVAKMRPRLVRVQRVAEAAPVVGVRAETFAREGGDLPAPHAPVGDPRVQEHDGRPVPGRLDRDVGGARPDRAGGHPGRVVAIDSRPPNHANQAAALGWRSRQASDAKRKSR